MRKKSKRAPMPRGREIGWLDYLYMHENKCCVGERYIFRRGEEDLFVKAYSNALDSQPSGVEYHVRNGEEQFARRLRSKTADLFGYDE